MRLNKDWLAHADDLFGQVDSFKIYEGALPGSVATPPVSAPSIAYASELSLPLSDMVGIVTNPDVSTVLTFGAGDALAYEYNLSTPGDASTATLVTSALNNLASHYSCRQAVSSDGTKLIGTSAGTLTLESYTLTTPYKISGGQTSDANVTAVDTYSCKGLALASDDSKLIVLDATNTLVKSYSFGTPLDITTLTLDGTFDYSSVLVAGGTFANDVEISPDGLTLYVLHTTPERIAEFSLSVANDITTATLVTDHTSVNVAGTTLASLAVSSNGLDLIAVGQGNDTLMSFTITPGAATDALIADLSAGFTADVGNAFSPSQVGANTEMIWQGSTVQTTANVDGTMGYFIIQCSGAGKSFTLDGTITATGGGGDLEFITVAVTAGATVGIDSFKFSLNNVYNT